MTRHKNWTPGPWVVMNGGADIFSELESDSGDGVVSHPTDGWHIAEVPRTPTYDRGHMEVELGAGPREANARLMAAAPDLVEALETVWHKLLSEQSKASPVRQKVEAALAKAYGETE